MSTPIPFAESLPMVPEGHLNYGRHHRHHLQDNFEHIRQFSGDPRSLQTDQCLWQQAMRRNHDSAHLPNLAITRNGEYVDARSGITLRGTGDYAPHDGDRFFRRKDGTLVDVDRSGQVNEIIYPDGTRHKFGYDRNGNLAQVVTSDGAVWLRLGNQHRWICAGDQDPVMQPFMPNEQWRQPVYKQPFEHDRDRHSLNVENHLPKPIKEAPFAPDLPIHSKDPVLDILPFGANRIQKQDGSIVEYNRDGKVSEVRFPTGSSVNCSYDRKGELVFFQNPDKTVWIRDSKANIWRSSDGRTFDGTISVQDNGDFRVVRKNGTGQVIHTNGQVENLNVADAGKINRTPATDSKASDSQPVTRIEAPKRPDTSETEESHPSEKIKDLFAKLMKDPKIGQPGQINLVELQSMILDPFGQYKGEMAQLLVVLDHLMKQKYPRLAQGDRPFAPGGGLLKDRQITITEKEIEHLFDQNGRNMESPETLKRELDHLMRRTERLSRESSNELFPLGDQSICAKAVHSGNNHDLPVLAAIADIAERNPQLIKDMIRPSKEHPGAYEVKFPGDTRTPPRPIVVYPASEAEKALYASGGKFGAWVRILEKAYGDYCNHTRIHKSESKIEGADAPGGRAEAFELFTGQTEEQFHARSLKKL